MSRDLDAVLASIDGALADDEFPDAMRWSPEPETIDAPAPFDGDLVWQPEQRYEDAGTSREWWPGSGVPFTVRRGGIRYPRPDEVIGHVDRVVEDEAGVRVEGTLNDAGRSLLDQIVAPLADAPVASADPLGDLIRATETVRRRIPPERLNCRCEVRPVYRGPVVRHLILDEAFLVDPAYRATVVAERQEEAQRIARQLGDWFSSVAEAVQSTAEQIGKAFAALVPTPAAPPRSLRETDPRAYALQLRQSRGTGPDRQVQHRHRPRRHS